MNAMDDKYILKMKFARQSNATIAAKLGVTEKEVVERLAYLHRLGETIMVNGYANLSEQFTTMAYQYQLLGESLKIVATSLGELMPEAEVAALVDKDPNQTVTNFLTKAIVLRPAKIQESPAASFAAQQAAN
jgi:DNA-binding Lrp family transcriptional regulator